MVENLTKSENWANDSYYYGFDMAWDGLGIAMNADQDYDSNYYGHLLAAAALGEAGSFLYNFDFFWNYDIVGSPSNDCVVPYASQIMVNSGAVIPLHGLSHTEETSGGTPAILSVLAFLTGH